METTRKDADMTFEIKDMQIFIHKNTVEPGSNKPPIKGSMMVGGVEYQIALWGSKSGKDGSYSGKVSLPYKSTQQPVETTPALDAINDELIPF